MFTTLILQSCGSNNPAAGIPGVEKGVIDLSRLQCSAVINLNGKWEFYWSRLLAPPDFNSGKQHPVKYISVPSVWNKERNDSAVYPAVGYATYRLVIKVNPNSIPGIFQIRMGEVFTASRLWINGKEAGRVGQVGTAKAAASPRYSSRVISFYAAKPRIEVIVQVANFHYKDGGIRDRVRFGRSPFLDNDMREGLLSNYILFGCLFIMALYHFGLFFIRRQDRSVLYFGILNLLFASRILVTNEMFVTSLFPALSWDLHLKMIVLGYYLGFAVFFTFVYYLYRQEFSKVILRVAQALTLLFSIPVLFTSPLFYTRTEVYFQVILLLGALYVIYVLIRALVNKRDGAGLMIAGMLLFLVTAVNDILHAQYVRGFTDIQSLVPFGLFVLIFSQAYILSIHFSRAFYLANTDPLTQISNRRHFFELAEKMFLEAQRNMRTISLLFMDLDHFKFINDTHGHDTGDIVLRNFTRLVRSVMHRSHILGRMGGEEFALLMPCDYAKAGEIAERIRNVVEETEIPLPEGSIRITVSIGLSSSQNRDIISLKKLFIHADKALYRSKEEGRNRVSCDQF